MSLLVENSKLTEIRSSLFNFSENSGFHQSLFGVFPTFNCHSTKATKIITNFDPSWMEHYQEKDYKLYDKAYSHCTSGTDQPYIWPGNSHLHGYTPKERRVYREANSAGICHGVTVPVSTLPGVLSTVSFGFEGSKREFESHFLNFQKSIIQFSYQLTEQAIRTDNPFVSQYKLLSIREQDALCWLASGFTYDQIATKMGVGSSTVRKHIASVLKKLNARNSVHASAIAVRWGLI